MSLAAFARGILAGYGVAIPLGPITLLIMELGIQRGFSSAICAAAGAATADLVYAIIAVLAGTVIAGLLLPFARPLHYLSGGVLILIGLWLLYERRHRAEVRSDTRNLEPRNYFQTYTMILGLTLLNPVTITYFTALILGLQTSESRSFADEWYFVAGIFSASLSWQTLLAGVGTIVGKRVSLRFRAITQVSGSLLIVGLGVAILLGLF